MAKWKVTPKTINNSMAGQIDYDDKESRWQIYQDEKPFLEQAKQDREKKSKKDVGYKKFATVPDIVSIEIMEKHGINIHDPNFLHDADKKKKFMKIIKSEYSYLMAY